ncbi:coiled-coil domain-containing protein 40-like [Pectinophora gossypiella]|uniref:coiled-coil domain-containing protein 40-like n=1 Tax=Pectinophora gossypiella TaxID=13191 RepID=UPI00214EB809|nr:coiled-coil domain-containing protein 40-like [Pectinophora gossypiella]
MDKVSKSERSCKCTEDTVSTSRTLTPDCECPRDERDIVIHEESCLLFKYETIITPHDPELCECPPFPTPVCECCKCLIEQCTCKTSARDALEEWRVTRDVGPMPAVLESTHPLMQKFQESLRRFLEKENELAEQEIIALRAELKEGKTAYEAELEGVYRSDHDTNGQRVLIEEYEATLANETKARHDAEERARIANEKFRQLKDKFDNEMMTERESTEELEALTALVRQLEKWREETESDLTVSQRMSEKMRREKKELGDEKRQLDMVIYGLSNEVWKLQSRLELFKKQMEIKNSEMDRVTDKTIAYATELEDLEMDEKRLMSLWNSVLVNIKQRDKVFDSVRDDYKALQENYRTLMCNLEITKRINNEELNRSKELAMNRDKLNYDMAALSKTFESEDETRRDLEAEMEHLTQSIEMSERDEELLKMENQTMRNILATTEKELSRRSNLKLKLENEILTNLQECLLNDKAVETMAKGIKHMRDMSRKLEISLMTIENQHAKVMLDIEVHHNRQLKNKSIAEKKLEQVREREKELDQLQDKFDQKSSLMMKKQRELDIVLKKYVALKEVFDMKSPQERRIDEMEQQIRSLRDRTEVMQHEWLRLQGHVVKLATQYQKIIADISLLNKQIQICDQKTMHIQANLETVHQERIKVDRQLRDLRGQLEVLERTRKEANERNQCTQRVNLALTHEYTANLKNAESELIELEDEIEVLEKDKMNLTHELDSKQREAMVWQRKGILAVELKRSIYEAKSSAGEIGQMKNEIHRMEVRREQLRRTAEKLAEDLALYVTRRETAMDKTRALAAVEKARGVPGHTSQSTYHHKLRLAKADVARVTKELAESKARMSELRREQDRLEKEVRETSAMNTQLEEQVATLLRECRDTERDKQWLLERVVRSQRLGSELARAVKRQSLRIRKPKNSVITEFNQARALNDRLRFMVENLMREYPHLEERLTVIANTLNIYSPSNSPRLTEEGTCYDETEDGAPGCVIPEETVEEEEKIQCAPECECEAKQIRDREEARAREEALAKAEAEKCEEEEEP